MNGVVRINILLLYCSLYTRTTNKAKNTGGVILDVLLNIQSENPAIDRPVSKRNVIRKHYKSLLNR